MSIHIHSLQLPYTLRAASPPLLVAVVGGKHRLWLSVSRLLSSSDELPWHMHTHVLRRNGVGPATPLKPGVAHSRRTLFACTMPAMLSILIEQALQHTACGPSHMQLGGSLQVATGRYKRVRLTQLNPYGVCFTPTMLARPAVE
jgi:hypothetical protein